MQASKIKIGKIYAVKRDDELVRFTVSSVTTRRVNDYGNPHDYEATVQGYFVGEREPTTLDPKRVLGPFEEYQELVAKQAAEKAERDRQASEAKQHADDVRMWLYRITKIPVPADKYKQLFDSDYSHSVRINADGVEALFKYIKESKT